MQVTVRAMTADDCSDVLALWRRTEGIGLNESESAPEVAKFLSRNPELSHVALSADGAVLGAVLCGHDGRRGYLHHLAVDVMHRRRGIARALVEHCLSRLHALGIRKCNIFLFRDNGRGSEFWQHNGWSERDDLRVFQTVLR
jgi:ribosomal protein S18 acetylase RimI-like enzyme